MEGRRFRETNQNGARLCILVQRMGLWPSMRATRAKRQVSTAEAQRAERFLQRSKFAERIQFGSRKVPGRDRFVALWIF